ncbi:MAG: SRPBCC family protein [Haloarculaceae archaeon]
MTVTRTVDTPPERVREAMSDVETFMRAAGFAEVDLDGDRLHIANTAGLFLEIELDLELVERRDAVLAYEQREGIFREMRTVYRIEPTDGGTTVTATTEFEVDVALAGPLLDASVVTRQRRAELRKQFDYLEGLAD